MSTQQFLKGLLMAIVGIVVAALSTQPIDWILLAITAVCTILTYVGKNLALVVLRSDSAPGALSAINIISGLLIALGTGLLEGVGMYLISGAIVWAVLLKVVANVTLTYVIATWFAPPYNPAKTVTLFSRGKLAA